MSASTISRGKIGYASDSLLEIDSLHPPIVANKQVSFSSSKQRSAQRIDLIDPLEEFTSSPTQSQSSIAIPFGARRQPPLNQFELEQAKQAKIQKKSKFIKEFKEFISNTHSQAAVATNTSQAQLSSPTKLVSAMKQQQQQQPSLFFTAASASASASATTTSPQLTSTKSIQKKQSQIPQFFPSSLRNSAELSSDKNNLQQLQPLNRSSTKAISQISESSQLKGNLNNETPTNQFYSSSSPLQRQRTLSIASHFQRRLKIQHKSKDDRFNENLKVFKGMSTFVETKQFFQQMSNTNNNKSSNANRVTPLANQPNKSFLQQDKFSENATAFQHTYTCEQESANSIEMLRNSTANIVDEQDENSPKAKYDMTNPKFTENIADLIEDTYQKLNLVVSRNKNASDHDLKTQTCKTQVTACALTEEEYLLQLLREELKQQIQFQEKEKQQTQANQQSLLKMQQRQRKPQEGQLNTNLNHGGVSQNRINQENLTQSNNNNGFPVPKNGVSSLLKNAILQQQSIPNSTSDDQSNQNDAKTQYAEFVEKSLQVHATLRRLNENFFKQKWANAQMKRKQEREIIRRQIMIQLKSEDCSQKKAGDLQYPGKNKQMQQVKSKIDTNLDFLDIQIPTQTSEFHLAASSSNSNGLNGHFNSNAASAGSFINPFLDTPKNRRQQSYQSLKIPIAKRMNYSEEKQLKQAKASSPSLKFPPPSLSNFNSNVSTQLFSRTASSQGNIFAFNSKNPSNPSLSSSFLDQIQMENPQKLPTQQVAPFKSLNSVDIKQTKGMNVSNSKNKQINLFDKRYSFPKSPVYLSPKQMRKSSTSIAGFPLIPSQMSGVSLNEEDQLEFDALLQSDENYDDENENEFRQQILQQKQFQLNCNASSEQRQKLNQLIDRIDVQKEIDRQENKELENAISRVQIDCDDEMKHIAGNNLDRISSILDLNVARFQNKALPAHHITNSRVKSFLSKND